MSQLLQKISSPSLLLRFAILRLVLAASSYVAQDTSAECALSEHSLMEIEDEDLPCFASSSLLQTNIVTRTEQVGAQAFSSEIRYLKKQLHWDSDLFPCQTSMLQFAQPEGDGDRSTPRTGGGGNYEAEEPVNGTSSKSQQEDVFQEGHPEQTVIAVENYEIVVLSGICAALVFVEIFIVRRWFADSIQGHCAALGLYILVGLCYDIGEFNKSRLIGLDWLSGYLLEWMLSVDNLFVFYLVIKLYKVPAASLNKALYAGITGAFVLRAIFFFCLLHILEVGYWVKALLGVFIAYSGVMCLQDDDDEDITKYQSVKMLKAILGDRLMDSYSEEGDVFVNKDGKYRMTMLGFVIGIVELLDVVFAIDSVTAKVASIPDLWLCFSSSVLALFALRSAFFVLRDGMEYFHYLKYGVALVLVFIGAQLILSQWIDITAGQLCMFLGAVFFVSIAASLARLAGQFAAESKAKEEQEERETVSNLNKREAS